MAGGAQDGPPGDSTFLVQVGPTPAVGQEVTTTVEGLVPRDGRAAVTSWFARGRTGCPTRSTPVAGRRRSVTSTIAGSFRIQRYDTPRRTGPHRLCVFVEALRDGQRRPHRRSRVIASSGVLLDVR